MVLVHDASSNQRLAVLVLGRTEVALITVDRVQIGERYGEIHPVGPEGGLGNTKPG